MKLITYVLTLTTLLLSFSVTKAQVQNAVTESVSIDGNCGMCKTAIEKAGNVKSTVIVNWNKDSKTAILTYDSKKTNQAEILKRIALAGYDNEMFLAPADAYAKLPSCCQYERDRKSPMIAGLDKMDMSGVDHVTHIKKIDTPKETVKLEKNHDDHSSDKPKMKNSGEKATMDMKSGDHTKHKTKSAEKSQDSTPLKAVFDAYFEMKDAFVKTNATDASVNAKTLLSAINGVKMESLPMDIHMVWMKKMDNLKSDVQHIAEAKDIAIQRNYFMTLSSNIYELMKLSELEAPVYYQFCPMANNGKGANWLSKESAIKNPYYGSQMLSCGKTVETIE